MANQEIETDPNSQVSEPTGSTPPPPADEIGKETLPPQAPLIGGPEPSSNKWLWIVIGLLVLIAIVVLVYYFLIKSPQPTEEAQEVTPVTQETPTTSGGAGEVPQTTPVAPGQTAEGLQPYETTPGEEELAEPGQAINFSVSYPPDWTSRVLDEEVKKGGAGNILYFVAFGKEPPTLTPEANKMVIYADSRLFQNMVELVTYKEAAKKTETTYGGRKAVKWVGEKINPIRTTAAATVVTVVIEAPAGWSLVVEGKGADEQIIDQMLSTLVFLPA